MNLNPLLLCFGIYVCHWLPLVSSTVIPPQNTQQAPVKLLELDPNHVTIDNGIVQVNISKPQGFVTGIAYNGIPNVLDHRQKEDARGYWDVVWSKLGTGKDNFDKLETTDYKLIASTEDHVEVSFSKVWKSGDPTVPLNVDKRYIVVKGKPGLYAYSIMERLKGWPEVNMDQIRIAFKLHPDLFDYMIVSDELHRYMPTVEEHNSGQPLVFPEAVILKGTKNHTFEGQVDDKYQYSMELRDSKVHGFVTSTQPQVGFWMIRPSDEYNIGGPMRQDLTSHAGPTVLGMFTSIHYGGPDLDTEYRTGDAWKKVFGPSFIYLNSVPTGGDYMQFWDDSKQQAETEVKEWPYEFADSEDYPKAAMRGSVSGQLTLENEGEATTGKSAYLLLEKPGEAGSWKLETKGYVFWTQADLEGNFVIKNVRPGEYNLYGWVLGFVGDFKHETLITIEPGKEVKLGPIAYRTPRNGPTIWEIGVPDRTAAEFFVPDPNPSYVNPLFLNKPAQKYRQYGLWDRYSAVYPKNDLVFTVGTSNASHDWFYAQVPRKTGNGYESTTWQIVFDLQEVQPSGNYTFQLSVAGSSSGSLQVRVNVSPDAPKRPLLATGKIGEDSAIARHGIHGLYWLYTVGIPCDVLVAGKNTIYLTSGRPTAGFRGVMYDYLRLEAPPV